MKFKVICDTRNNTQESINKNKLIVDIILFLDRCISKQRSGQGDTEKEN